MAPSGSCVGSIRHQHAMVARRAGDTALAERADRAGGQDLRAVRTAGRRARADRRRRLLPAPGHLSPDLPLAADAAGRRQAAVAAARGTRASTWSNCPQADACCGFGGTFALKNSDTSSAMSADKIGNVLSTGAEVCSAGDSSCLMHIGGGLSRLRQRGPHRAPGRDPGVDEGEPGMTVRRSSGDPPGVRRRAPRRNRRCAAPSRSRRRPRTRTGQRATPPQPRPRDVHHPRQTRPGRRRDAGLGGAAGRRFGDQDRRDGPAAGAAGTAGGERHRPRRRRALGRRRRTRPTGSSPTWCGPPAPTRWSRSNRWPPRRSASTSTSRNAGIAAVRDRPRRTDRAARRTTSHRTSWCPRSTATAPRSGTSSCAEMDDAPSRSHRRPAPAGDGRPGTPAAQVPDRQGRGVRRQLRHRRHRHPVRGRVRGQRPDVPDAAARP